MRLVLLLCLVLAAAAAADREAVTLTDGRTLVGVYDADAGTIALDGKGTALVKVRADQVATRAPAAPRQAPPAATAPQGAAAPAKAIQRDSLNEALADIKRVQEESAAQQEAIARRWLGSLNLEPIPEPKIGDDPRQSDLARRDEIRRLNGLLTELRKARDGRDPNAAQRALHDAADNGELARHQELLAEAAAGRP